MTKECELLERAEECLRHAEYPNDYREQEADDLRNEIRTFLSTPSGDAEEPVVWLLQKYGGRGDVITSLSRHPEPGATPLYLHPPKPAEPVEFLCNATRFKITGSKAEGMIYGIPQYLIGKWVAFVDADNGQHLKITKPAEQEETIEKLQSENFALASGQCTEGGPWGDEDGTLYCKYAEPAARKPMTKEEITDAYYRSYTNQYGDFESGVRSAEKHHLIGESDE